MEIKVCKNCRRLFKYMFGPELCPECARFVRENKSEPKMAEPIAALKPMVLEDEEMYEKVKDYIMSNPKASVSLIAEKNGVPITKIFEWIKEERLEFSDDSANAWFICEKCGARIRSGRFCSRCKLR